jgi:ADP-ribosylglycohydrolase
MAGAIAGAYYGASGLPARWTDNMENEGKGKDYVIKLADALYAHQAKKP